MQRPGERPLLLDTVKAFAREQWVRATMGLRIRWEDAKERRIDHALRNTGIAQAILDYPFSAGGATYTEAGITLNDVTFRVARRQTRPENAEVPARTMIYVDFKDDDIAQQAVSRHGLPVTLTYSFFTREIFAGERNRRDGHSLRITETQAVAMRQIEERIKIVDAT